MDESCSLKFFQGKLHNGNPWHEIIYIYIKSSSPWQLFWDGEGWNDVGTPIRKPPRNIDSPEVFDTFTGPAIFRSKDCRQNPSTPLQLVQLSLEKISTSRADGESSNSSEQYPNSQATGRSLGVTQPSSTANVGLKPLKTSQNLQ